MELPIDCTSGCEREVTLKAIRESQVSESFSLDTKEQIRQAIDIVDLVGSYITLRRQGRGYVGICPWHDDTRPSLQVNPERQSFKCWVCDIGGDIFSFVMKAEGVEFREALELLAERAGVELKPVRQTTSNTGGASPADHKKTLFRAAAWTEGLFHRFLLDSPEAEPARNYLSQRGITEASIDRFQIGFAPNRRNWILSQAEGDADRAKVLETLGLIVRRDDGSYYDRFAGRVLFSIRDTQDRPVGIGGRVLPESGNTSPAKYLNSPETPLFTKHQLLYGLSLAKDAIRRAGQVLVMEGYTDVIAAHQTGFENAVAVLGTALGEEHVRILHRFAEQVVLVLDGDEAGRRRANEVLELFLAQNVDLQILTLPEAADPCDFLLTQGADAFDHLLKTEAVDALDHVIRVETEGIDLETDIHAAGKSLERIISILAKRTQPTGEERFREQRILHRLSRSFHIPEEDVRQRLVQIRRKPKRVYTPRVVETPHVAQVDDPNALLAAAGEDDENFGEATAALPAVTSGGNVEITPPPKPPKLNDLHRMAPIECELLELVVANPELLPKAREVFEPNRFSDAASRRLYETCCRLEDEDVCPDFSRLMLEFDDGPMKQFLVELDESRRVAKITDPAALLQELIERYQQNQLDRQRSSQIVALKDEGLDETRKTQMLQEMMEQLRARHGISRPTEGPDHDRVDPDPISFDPAAFETEGNGEDDDSLDVKFDPNEF